MTPHIEEYREIYLTQGQVAKVSPHRFAELNQWRWQAQWNASGRCFYARRSAPRREDGSRGGAIWMHRYILSLPSGGILSADHINHDSLDNTYENLRVATVTEQRRNRRIHRTNKSGYKGVYLKKWRNETRWGACIQVNKKNMTLGYFRDKIEAARAYDAAASKHFGDFAHLNFPLQIG